MRQHSTTHHFTHEDQATEIPILERSNKYFIVGDMTNGNITIHVPAKICTSIEEAKSFALEKYNEIYGDG